MSFCKLSIVKSNRFFVALIALLLCAYGGAKYLVDKRVALRKDKFDIRMLPTPQTARFMAVGFEAALADVYWIEGLNYFGGELTNKNRTYKYMESYVDLIEGLDPNFATFYEWASTIFIYNALPITRDQVRKAVKYANSGIVNLDKIHRYNAQTIIKNAFNFALELHDNKTALEYFTFAGRSFEDQRDMLLVGSSYALYDNNLSESTNLRLEYLAYIAFQAQSRDQLLYALRLLSSNKTQNKTGDFLRALRLKMETDEDVKKIVAARLKDSPMMEKMILAPQEFMLDKRIQNIVNIDFTRTWMPPDLLTLVSM